MASVDENGLVQEGKALIAGSVVDSNNVFYNPVQVFNRDLSILAIRAFWTEHVAEERAKAMAKRLRRAAVSADGRKMSVDGSSTNPDELMADWVSPKCNMLEPLAATGLRSIRYALELSDMNALLVAGDLDVEAVKIMEKNIERNGISPTKLRAVKCDANQLMHLCHYGGIEASAAFVLPSDVPTPALETSSTPAPPLETPPTPAKPLSHFNVIDLDPYGSVAGFLDAAVQSVADGGLLCITSTDMPILCGNNPEVSYYKYGGTAVKSRCMHEMSLRLLINAASISAARHKRIIEPLMCCSVDFYVRCFVRVRESPAGCKLLASRSALSFQCTNCDAFTIAPLGITQARDEAQKRANAETVEGQTGNSEASNSEGQINPLIPEKLNAAKLNPSKMNPANLKYRAPQIPAGFAGSDCAQCGSKSIWISGPFYSGSLYDKAFVDRCLELSSGDLTNTPLSSLTMVPRIRGFLTAVSEELWDVPLYYHLPSLFNRIKVEMMKTSHFKSALLNLGFRVSHFHRDPQSVKTDAPSNVLFDILRVWAKKNPPKEPEKYQILKKAITNEEDINFQVHTASLSISPDVPKWLPNPSTHWGPKARAGPNAQRPQRAKRQRDKETEEASKEARTS